MSLMRFNAKYSPSIHTLTAVSALLLACSWSVDASAQAESSEPSAGEASAAAPSAEAATLRVTVFVEDADKNVEGMVLLVDGKEYPFGESSSVEAEVKAGEHQGQLRYSDKGGKSKLIALGALPAVAGAATQVVATTNLAGELVSLDVQAPEGSEVKGEETVEAPVELKFGKIHGRITSDTDNSPIAGARVFVKGLDAEAESDASGNFELEVPVGEHTISVIHSKFSTQNLAEVKVVEGQTTEVKPSLAPAAMELEAFVVTAPYVEGGISRATDERKESAAVQEVLGSEQMSKSGDSSAASALKRVSGLSIIGGKFIYIRGMSERYSNTLVNGAFVPSPEPERRVIPMDMFPSAVLDSVVVKKTYSPDLPGDFGAGLVELKTKSYPKEFLFKIDGSIGVNTISSFQQSVGYQGGSTDFLGIDDGSRAMSPELASASDGQYIKKKGFSTGYSPEELAAIGGSLPNNYNVQKKTLSPIGNLAVTVGDSFKIGEVPVGYMASLIWGDDTTRRSVQGAQYAMVVSEDKPEGEFQNQGEFTTEAVDREIRLGGILDLGVEVAKGHKIKSTTLLLRMSADETRFATGKSFESGGQDFRTSQLRWIERQLFTEQLSGEHLFPMFDNLKFDWRYSLSSATRSEPDRRTYTYINQSSPTYGGYRYKMTNDGEGNQRAWGSMNEMLHNGVLDFTYPVKFFGKHESNIKLGGNFLQRNRDSELRRFQNYFAGSDLKQESSTQGPESLFSNSNFTANGINFLERSSTDVYTAELGVQAGYIMGDIKFSESFDINTGLRFERAKMSVLTYDISESFTEAKATGGFDNFNVLPAINLNWRATKEHVFRAAASGTVSRPDFRELSTAQFFEVETGLRYRGNADLQESKIYAVDVRWEWYFGADESISVGSFYKNIEKPIEQIQETLWLSWQNANYANIIGGEFEGRTRFGFIDKSLDSFYTSGNLTLIYSEVELVPGSLSTNTERPMQGQSPYVVNLQLGYDDTDDPDALGISAGLLYNVFGPRIARVGAFGLPDTYLQSFHQLDFVMSKKFDKHIKLGFKAQNILNSTMSYTMRNPSTDVEVSVGNYKIGSEYSLSLSYTY